MNVLVIGGSDGIGLAVTERLLAAGHTVRGISRSASRIEHAAYEHTQANVTMPAYREALAESVAALGTVDVCIYCAGIGESIDLDNLAVDRNVFETNLVGAVTTIEAVLPSMLEARAGHFVGLSSQADTFINADAPSYSASKAGMSSYLEGLALACRKRGVYITNVRFGFVDTKLAKSEIKPFMVSADKAAAKVMRCLRKKPIRYTYPKRMAALLWFARWGPRFRIWFS